MDYSAAMTEGTAVQMREFLLRDTRDEEICFALWRPAVGKSRYNILLREPLYPGDGDRRRHGNVSAYPGYVDRCKESARESGAGLAMVHTHPGARGHQDVSQPDLHYEQDVLSREVFGITGLPLVGVTLAGDGTWSARAYPPPFKICWCSTVRTVGKMLRVDFNPNLAPAPKAGAKSERTSSVWGHERQADLTRLSVGIVGAGSVGSVAGEILARTGVGQILAMDYDTVKEHNLDRLMGASDVDVGRFKTDVLAENLARSAMSDEFACATSSSSVVESAGFAEVLDCDIVFCCADRPWPRQVLNHAAYSCLVPVIDGGVGIRIRKGRLVHGVYRAQAVGPHRACLGCLGALDLGEVAADRAGMFDDPGYVERLEAEDGPTRQNIMAFSAGLASLETLQFIEMVTGLAGKGDLGQQPYDCRTGEILPRHTVCKKGCASPGLVALGDSCRPFLGTDRSRERDLAAARAGRAGRRDVRISRDPAAARAGRAGRLGARIRRALGLKTAGR